MWSAGGNFRVRSSRRCTRPTVPGRGCPSRQDRLAGYREISAATGSANAPGRYCEGRGSSGFCDGCSKHAWRSLHIGMKGEPRSEEHTSELQSLMRISYAVFCLTKKTQHTDEH